MTGVTIDTLSNIYYRNVMASTKDHNRTETDTIVPIRGRASKRDLLERITSRLHRNTYLGSLLWNVGTFTLPALYNTLSKLWVAKIDSSKVVTTDVYGYIGTIVEVLNEGLPRAAWTTIGDKTTRTTKSRIELSYTLVAAQSILGSVMTVIFIASADRLAAAFVPVEVRKTSLKYVRISSVQAITSAIETAVSSSTRALDHPDVPLVISSTKIVLNIVLDLLLISRFHVGSHQPTVETQAWIRMACDIFSAGCGLSYFVFLVSMLRRNGGLPSERIRPSLRLLRVLIAPGIWTFAESAVRNALYLWLVSGIVAMGSDYATSFGVFNTIRWGLIMVPILSLEQSSLAFVGHAWGVWRAQVGSERRRAKATWKDELGIARAALLSCALAVIIEVPLCLFLSFWGIRDFAFYLSASNEVARITQKMWKSIDWCYIFYALYVQIGAILLATIPRLYFCQSLASNLFWTLPWAIAVTRVGMTPQSAWTYHSVIFGGALVFNFVMATCVLALVAWRLTKGSVSLQVIQAAP